MPTCKDCDLSEGLEWGETKEGKPYLVQIRRIPHFRLCPAKKGEKNGQKPAKAQRQPRKPRASPATEPERMLKEMGYPNYAEMLKDIPEAEPGVMVLAALQRKGKE